MIARNEYGFSRPQLTHDEFLVSRSSFSRYIAVYIRARGTNALTGPGRPASARADKFSVKFRKVNLREIL